MNILLFTLVVVLAMGGCSTEEHIYGTQPLVAKVQTGSPHVKAVVVATDRRGALKPPALSRLSK